jgi:hypothetical protein
VSGFVLAVIANLWNFGLTFVRWPRVSVETRRYVYGGTEPVDHSQDKIVLTVINRGSEAVTISDIGLRAEDRSQRRAFEYDRLHYPDRLPDHGPPFPVRLEGHGALRWIYGSYQLAEFRKGSQVRGYAKVYRSFRRWRSEITDRTIDAPRTALID